VIFVDSSFWIGAGDRRDDRHPAAIALLAARESERFVTTNHVLGETWTFLRTRSGHRIATDFVERVDNAGDVEVAFVTPELERSAWVWLRQHDERAYSFVDATSFALMRHRRIGEALAFDGDFTAAGFVELRP
jgi:predicted nucleic acid-binding protein